MRTLATKRGLALTEDGFTRGQEKIPCPTEEEVYSTLGLCWIPPELREDHGELQAARDRTLPELVQLGDLKGDLHTHSDWSDGTGTLSAMAEAAMSLGYEYLVISDHTHSLGVAKGLDLDQLHKQRAEIERLNAKFLDIRILQGAEVEVRSDGSLDYPDDCLADLDIVIAAVHSGLRQDQQGLTERAVRAMRHPHVDILAHPSGRIPGRREASNINLDTVLRVAVETGTILEVNAHRLDLDDAHVSRAIRLGVPLAVVSDAHHTAALDTIRYAVATARRGWAGPRHVVNTLPLKQIVDLLSRNKAARRAALASVLPQTRP
jgi:DNA polymerase (family 10)